MLSSFGESLSRLRLALRFATQNVRADARRVMLALLGVAIGIAAVASMLLIGHSVTAMATHAVERLGGDVVTVSLMPPSQSGVVEHDAAEGSDMGRVVDAIAAVVRTMPEAQTVTKLVRAADCTVVPMSDNMESTEILAVEPKLAEALSLTVEAGRFLHPLDGRQPWAVLGANAVKTLRRTYPDLKPGSSLDLCGRTFYVAGFLSPYFGDDLLDEFQVNRAILVSFSAATRLASTRPPSQLLVRMRRSASDSDMVEPLTNRLRTIIEKPVRVSGARQMSQFRQEQTSLYTRFLAILGGVALAVGSLGITNVMLVSVAERKAEIGLRMALGASTRDVVFQFLVESVLICLCGAVLGLLLGVLGAGIALSVANIELAFNVGTALSVAALAVLSGLVAGAYPALRAARLDPVSTLQGQS